MADYHLLSFNPDDSNNIIRSVSTIKSYKYGNVKWIQSNNNWYNVLNNSDFAFTMNTFVVNIPAGIYTIDKLLLALETSIASAVGITVTATYDETQNRIRFVSLSNFAITSVGSGMARVSGMNIVTSTLDTTFINAPNLSLGNIFMSISNLNSLGSTATSSNNSKSFSVVIPKASPLSYSLYDQINYKFNFTGPVKSYNISLFNEYPELTMEGADINIMLELCY